MFNNESHTVAITRNAAIIIYSRVKDSVTKSPNLELELEMVNQIFVNSIQPGLTIKSS